MSLSPFDSFQSRFVNYLFNFPRILFQLQNNDEQLFSKVLQNEYLISLDKSRYYKPNLMPDNIILFKLFLNMIIMNYIENTNYKPGTRICEYRLYVTIVTLRIA